MIMNEAALDPRAEKAVEMALTSQWDEAVKLNSEILKDYPQDINTLNRLGRAYAELGNISKAKSCFQKVTKLDQYNSIASNNLKRLASIKASDVRRVAGAALDPDIFLEEPGKTKVIELVDLAMDSLLASLRTGDSVELKPYKNEVVAVSDSGKRIGKLPDPWGEILAKVLNSGNEFLAVIKATYLKKPPVVSIFVRETKRNPKQATPTFPPTNSNFTPYVREEALGMLSNQAPVENESEESSEDLSLKEIPEDTPSSLEAIQAKEIEDQALYDEEET